MLRQTLAAATALATLAGAANATTLPRLYVYRWGGQPQNLPQFQNMLGGRQVDGEVDFNDYTQTAANAASNADWDLGQWQGKVPDMIYKVGLTFADMSVQDVAAGKADATYTHIGQSLISHGFPKATIPLGWEMNGGWYGWGQKGAAYGAAYLHASQVLKAACPQCSIMWNPAAGLDPSSEAPPAGSVVDAVGPDEYANAWNCGGCKQQEPDLYNGNKTGWWGNWSFYPSPNTFIRAPRYLIPELGAGSRGDGHGACSGTAWNSCDDPYWLASAITDAAAAGVDSIGYWDVNAGDYNSEVSGGERPGQALVLMQYYGTPALQTALKGASAYSGSAYKVSGSTPAILVTLANGHVAQVGWSSTQTATVTDLTAPATPVPTPTPTPTQPTPTKPAPVIYPATISTKPVTASISPVGQITIVGDGSEWLAVQPPQTVPSLSWTYNVSPARRVGTATSVGGAVTYLNGGQPASSFVVDSAKGASQVFFIDKQ